MVVLPAASPPSATVQDSMHTLRNLLTHAREQPFDSEFAHRWHRALYAFAVRIDSLVQRDSAVVPLGTAAKALVRDLTGLEEPSIWDVVGVSETLFEMENELAQVLSFATPRDGPGICRG